jgi:hypothetical protein
VFVLAAYLAYVLATVLPSGRHARRVVVAAVAALAIVLVIATAQTARKFANPYRFFTAAKQTSPRNVHVALQLALSLERAGYIAVAKQELRKHASIIGEHGYASAGDRMLAWLHLQSGNYKAALVLVQGSRDYWGIALAAAIKIESPDLALRDRAAASAHVMMLQIEQSLWLIGRDGYDWERYRTPHIDALRASVAAANGRFDDAERLVTQALEHESLQGRGALRARIRADLLARQRSYHSATAYSSPESQALWRIPPWIR